MKIEFKSHLEKDYKAICILPTIVYLTDGGGRGVSLVWGPWEYIIIWNRS